jgi:hypothetical protein
VLISLCDAGNVFSLAIYPYLARSSQMFSSLSFTIKIIIAPHSPNKWVDMLFGTVKIVIILLEGLEK